MALTIGETVEQLHAALRDYIEATYHIGHPSLVEQRRQLLQQPGVISQRPYIESTPRYRIGEPFENLGLPTPVLDVFSSLATASDGPILIHNPPYHHQAKAIQKSLLENRSLVITTGTGSGKTECFLLPILGKLAQEAHEQGRAFGSMAATRALVLYPMNALVNDQLGRLRVLFGDDRIVDQFVDWSGRPARFARYTSRTLYPGVRTVDKDQLRLKAIGDFYVRYLELAQGPDSEEQRAAKRIVDQLKTRGKWPAKPDLLAWYGRKGMRWQDTKTGEFKRCVTLANDPELLTRHEVQETPPDILVTNYSMLEYMLMRPIERPIFDHTRDWLEQNPHERLLLVLDEAHLYRGAAGAEVALLIRRLRARLNIPQDRLQVICTSASFCDPAYASQFGAQLTGKDRREFETIEGELALSEAAGKGSSRDAAVLADLDLDSFYSGETDESRVAAVQSLLDYRAVNPKSDLPSTLHSALNEFPPMGELINLTMKAAEPVSELHGKIFPDAEPEAANRAVTALVAMGSLARKTSNTPGLLPCRVHGFFRGLAGLWVCMDPGCSALPEHRRDGPCGRLYSQPRDICTCGSRVLELYTCRNCGAAYARAYTNNILEPDFLWAEPGGEFRTHTGMFGELEPLDMLLDAPVRNDIEPADYDLITGRLNPGALGTRSRRVFLRGERISAGDGDVDTGHTAQRGEFVPCAVCGESAAYGRSSVQDHQTKGDEPFQALISKQIQVQPPNATPPTRLAPHRGRKVLIFSDSRQTAARLAPNLQTYSTRDVLRPLIVVGFDRLQRSASLATFLSLEDLYLAALIAAELLGVRLRPELKGGESFHARDKIEERLGAGALFDDNRMLELLMEMRGETPPQFLLRGMASCLTHRYYSLESFALASIVERASHREAISDLPDIPEVATTPEQKLALARLWLRSWHRSGFWLSRMPSSWWMNEVKPHSGKFATIENWLDTKDARKLFNRDWLEALLHRFTEPIAQNKYRLKGIELSLLTGGEWSYCQLCRTTQRPFPGTDRCVNCQTQNARQIDPATDPVFGARKGYYRSSTMESLREPPDPPLALIAAEHTAQLGAAQSDEVFSKAEEHELLFQDVELGRDDKGQERPAIDVLSCTTTMEVGIDIGTLSGVSLRNMPPARANYQQRAGRAGRRGNAVATVTAFGSADSHDEHYFSHPDEMIRGEVQDPTLTLNNAEITHRHVTAYLLQRYHQHKLPNIRPADQPHLFAVLGSVSDFKRKDTLLNRDDFASWMRIQESALQSEIAGWLPRELEASDRESLLSNLISRTLSDIDGAIGIDSTDGTDSERDGAEGTEREPAESNGEEQLEVPEETGEEQTGRDPGSENLLDRLLYKGVLPRYAFPTDVATFYVFNNEQSTRFRHVYTFTPSQGLPVALSQYSPGKEVWIASKLWTSGAIYSPVRSEMYDAWARRRLYYECTFCRYACTRELNDGSRGESLDCPACGRSATLGPARPWLRPPGFAHPVEREEGTTPDDQPARSYATRAKLTAPTPAEPDRWTTLNDRLRVHHMRQHLLVTNRGPRQDGYTYCTRCGRIEPTASASGTVGAAHRKPYPDDRVPTCPGGRASSGIVLGTDFITDVLLISLRVADPISLSAGVLATDVALRTISEALSKAACQRLGLEAQELQAEYRPALTEAGRLGFEAEIYMYDTLPGGAGFVRRVGEVGLQVFNDALQILEFCPEVCDRSCYRCLRSYKNKLEHELLDRQLGASLLRYLLTGTYSMSDVGRLNASTDLLYEDLSRQAIGGISVSRWHQVTLEDGSHVAVPIYVTRSDGTAFAVGLHSPLTPDDPHDDVLRDLKEYSSVLPVLTVDEILVRRNLPQATHFVLSRIV
ncbi:MAG: DEAD/DEAH box helicase [Candidatus Hydrogenedentes bacterium]|nr:DEAD/DEAH box helicase [Candidatus Hydrogenedentota bacterium]